MKSDLGFLRMSHPRDPERGEDGGATGQGSLPVSLDLDLTEQLQSSLPVDLLV
jgi:hypothetical protein